MTNTKLYLLSLPTFVFQHAHSSKKIGISEKSNHFFTIGKIYDGDLSTMYDSETLEPSPPSYIIKCDDGYFRKVAAEYFITLEEWRQQKLDKIL